MVLLTFLVFSSMLLLCSARLPAIELAALLSIFDETDGGSWIHSYGWNTSIDACGWWGVTCDASNTSIMYGLKEFVIYVSYLMHCYGYFLQIS